MEIKQKKREEIDEKYKWDLSSVYSSKKEIDKDIKRVKKLEKIIVNFKDKNLNENSLYDLLVNNLELCRLIEKLIIYSSLKTSEDCSNNEYQMLYGQISNLVQEISVSTSFVQNKILTLEEKEVKEFICKNSKLKEYEFLLEEMFREKKYILSDKEEKLISSLSQALSSTSETYDMFTNLDLKFGNIKDEEGNDVELTDSNISIFLKSKDENIRKEAFKMYYSTYGKYTNTISTLYNYHLITNKSLSKIRGYESMLSEALYSDNLPKNVYDNLIEVVNKNIDCLNNYYKIRKKILNKKDFHLYDRFAPFDFINNKKYSFEEGKELILDTFKIMGEDYHKILEKAFNERWIDVYNNVGKSSGAFSAGVYDSNPFILLNYENELIDVSTMAHELGHSVHTYLSKNNNPYQYYDYSLFIAEVASLTNEIIFNTLLIENEKDPKVKLIILDNLMKLFISNFFDATLYAEFEKDVHSRIENDEVLTSDYFNSLCLELNKKYYGKNIIVDEEIKYRWQIYDHLYRDFYLFKYATGISCAAYCASKILNYEKGFIEKYISFLKLGSSVYSKDALSNVEIDVNNKEFIESSVNFFNELLEKYKNIYNSIK